MFDTIRIGKSKLLVFLVVMSFIISGLPSPLSGSARFAPAAGAKRFPASKSLRPASAVSSVPVVQASQPTYDIVIQDDSSKNILRFNSTTGEFKFTRCSDGLTLTGTGNVSRRGSMYSLSQLSGPIRVTAGADTATGRASGSVQSSEGGSTLMDRDMSDNSANGDPQSPQVTLTGPNGGEIVDRGSSFTVSWNSSDDVGVASHTIFLSTDGGASFSSIASGIAGDATQYQWTAPTGVDNQQVRVKVVARDAACNASFDASDANFTLWNPPASFTHVAESPIYIAQGGFDSHIYLCNTSATAIVAELGLRKPSGEATVSAPAQVLLAAGEARKLNVLDYLTPAPPADPFDTNILKGSVRLRHNGTKDEDVQAMVAITRFGEQQSFASPFVYVTSSQGAESNGQCAPMFYVDDQTDALLALQNCRSYPVEVDVKLAYGTGEPGTANGVYYLPRITLAGQQRILTSLGQFKDQFQGAKWGTIVLSAPAQSVAAHTVMMSAENGFAFSSAFADPSLSTSTTKVASSLKLDYDTSLTPCVMVCNMSESDTREVTATFETDNGVVIPAQQITLGPGQQRLIELDPRQLLSPGQSAMADVRLSYAGNGKDIMAGAVSMSAQDGCAITARFVEPDASDGRRLLSPFFRMDARTQGIVQISNLGNSQVRAGVSMGFANSSQSAVTTDLLSVPARKTVTVNLQQYFDHVPDGVAAEGCLSLIHNGQPGTVVASFMALSGDSVETVFEGGPPFAANEFVVFPTVLTLQGGESATISAVGGGDVGTIAWDPDYGVITPEASPDPDVQSEIYSIPDDESEPDEAIIQVTSADGSQIISVKIQKVKLKNIETFTAAGAPTNGRLNPDGGTTFVLTGKKDFPAVPLKVKFRNIQNGLSAEVDIPVDSASRPEPKKLVGTAPTNTQFIGDAQVVVFADNGNTKISKKNLCNPCDPATDPNCPSSQTLCSAYYAFDPPSPPTSISVPGFNRLGGNLTITAAGGGFRRFESSANQVRVDPDVNIGGISFAVNIVNAGTPSTINGNVKRADADIKSCVIEGQVPCKRIAVTNPGGRRQDRVRSNIDLYNLLPGPPPVPQSRFPDNGFTIGGTVLTIRGENLDFTDNVTVGGTKAPIVTKTRTLLVVTTLPHIAGAANITLFDIDNAAPGGTTVPNGTFTYRVTPVTAIGNIYIVGDGEAVVQTVAPTGNMPINCINVPGDPPKLTLTQVEPPAPFNIPGVQAFRATGTYNCTQCPFGSTDGTISFTLGNSAATNNASLTLRVNRGVRVINSGGTCSGSF